MRRIGLAVALTVSLIWAPLAAEAQQVGKLYRIGILFQTTDNNYRQAILQGLTERGYVEGRNLAIGLDLRRDVLTGFPFSRSSWCGSRWT